MKNFTTVPITIGEKQISGAHTQPKKNFTFTAGKKLKLIAMIFMALKINFVNAQNSQTIPNTCNPIKDAASLKCQLDYANIKAACDNPVTLYIDTDYINLGTLTPDNFPLLIHEGVTLMGTYNIFSVDANTHQSTGTRIYFPYMYEYGLACSVDGVPLPTTGNYYLGSAFKMDSCSALRNICLIGPKNDTKDWRYFGYGQYLNLCYSTLPDSGFKPFEGTSTGVLVVGDSCYITDCEIYGFPFYGVEVRDMVYNNGFYTGAPGSFYFERNYVHNNKAYGYGYGLWVSGGSGQSRCVLDSTNSVFSCFPNLPGDTLLANGHKNHKVFNYDAPDEGAYISNCYFADNKHDVAGAGNRNSYYINETTFSQRSADFNINRHYVSEGTGPWACNPNPDTASYALGTQSAKDTLTRVGGNVTSVRNSVFYRVGHNLEVPYPNINRCSTIYSFARPELEIYNTFFANPPNIYNGLDSLIRIELGGDDRLFHWNYLLDSNLDIGEFQPNTVAEVANFPAASGAPFSVIASDTAAGNATSTDTAKFITEGTTLYFDTHLCLDGNRNPPGNEMINLWNFHELKNYIDDEIRTDNTNIGGSLAHDFRKVGIVNVNLVCIDTTNFHASDFAKQLITIKPWNNSARLTFWIKDTYIGRQLSSVGNCRPRVNDYSQTAPSESATGFEKYATINGVTVWHEDIAGDSGWEYVNVRTDDFFNPELTPCKGTLEIGLRAVDSVSAERVRGVTIYIDDVYMNTGSGANALENGDLESANVAPSKYNPLPIYPDVWFPVEEDSSAKFNYTKLNCEPVHLDTLGVNWPVDSTFNLKTATAGLSTDEVHSGSLAFKAWVEPFTNNAKAGGHNYTFYCEPGRKYHPGHYKGISQPYDRQTDLCGGNSNRLSFTVIPVPAKTGQALRITTRDYANEKKLLQVVSPIGGVLYEHEFNGNNYVFNNNLVQGVYFIKVSAGEKSAVKKMVIVN